MTMDLDPPRKLGWAPKIILLVVVIYFLLACLGLLPSPLMFAGYLLFGWAAYLRRVLPRVTVSTGGVLTAVVCLVGAWMLLHFFARWLWRGIGRMEKWRPKWSAAVLGIVVLMFVAGTAAVGVTHQSTWMLKSERKMFRFGFRPESNQMRCGMNMKQVVNGIRMYASEHGGQFPADLGLVAKDAELTVFSFVCPEAETDFPDSELTAAEVIDRVNRGMISYVYLGRGWTTAAPADVPIMAEPIQNHDYTGMNIGFADGHVEWFAMAEAKAILARHGRPPTTHAAGVK